MFSKGDVIEWVFTKRTWNHYGESSFKQGVIIDIMDNHYILTATDMIEPPVLKRYTTVNIQDSAIRLLGRLSKEEMLTHWSDEVRELGHAERR